MERSTDQKEQGVPYAFRTKMETRRKDKHGVQVSVIMQETIEWIQLQQKT